MRIGIFGGTFDPPHLGHLHLAQAARAQLQLDRVLWAPVGDPPHKRQQQISPAEDRVALVAAAIADEPAFALTRVDVDRPGPHFTADTLTLLAAEFPADELIFLMGGDSLHDLPTWGRPEAILAHCALGVLRRPGAVFDLDTLERALPGIRSKLAFVDVPPLDIASQEIRPRVQGGHSLAGLVPPAVAAEIARRGLYRDWAPPERRVAGQLPEGYREVLYWKLSESVRVLLAIQLLAFPLGAVAAPFFLWFAGRVGRATPADLAGAGDYAWLALSLVLTLTLHELAHGLVMQAFGARPRYGIKWEIGALYATAPGHAFSRNQYLLVIFAPLAALSLLALAGIAGLAGQLPWVPILALGATVNAMGACGDVYMGWRVARYPSSAYVIDEADGMRVFLPVR